MIKVLTYNIHKGFNFSGRRLVIHEMKQALAEYCIDWDILFLQEVVGENTRHAKRLSDWPTDAQHAFLALDNWKHCIYGANRQHRAGNHGNSILSRFEVKQFTNQNISTSRFEKRGVLHSQLIHPTLPHPLHVSCAHMDLSRWGQRIQLNRLATWIKESIPMDVPLILAGDFNDRSGASTHYLKKTLHLEDAVHFSRNLSLPTFPSFLPLVPLDRIYVRGLKVMESGVLTGAPWNKLSDHLPVYAILDFT